MKSCIYFWKKTKTLSYLIIVIKKKILKIDTTFYKLNVLEGSQYFLDYIQVTFEPGSITQNLSIFFPITHKEIY